MSIPIQVTIDCADPDRLAHFWADLLGYQLDSPPEGFDSWEAWLTEQGIPESEWNSASAITDPDGHGARIFFQRVPEKKEQKNRVHLDVNAGGPRGTPDDERRAVGRQCGRAGHRDRRGEGPSGRRARRAALRDARPGRQRILPAVAPAANRPGVLKTRLLEPRARIELATYALRMRCSTD